ncbi:MAG: cytochrome c peroxidase [Planctomycetota bacterium]
MSDSRLHLFDACVAITVLSVMTSSGLASESGILSFPGRPVAVIYSDDVVLVAGRDTGTVRGYELRNSDARLERRLSERLDDLLELRESGLLVGVDALLHRVVVASVQPAGSEVVQRLQVARYPVSVVSDRTEQRVAVASKWSRRVTLFRVSSETRRLSAEAVIDLPFAPLRQLFLDNRFLLVTDAHGGELAVVDVMAGRLRSHQKLPGHNIRGLALTPDGKSVVLAHQILNAAASTTRSIISWGGVISNTLHRIPVDDLLKSTATGSPGRVHGTLFPLGRERRAAGDPSDIAITSDGRIFVALSGVHEVAVKSPRSFDVQRVAVGRRPTRLVLDENRNRLFVVCTSESTVEILNATTLQRERVLDFGSQAVRDYAARGEELFYDARLSLDGWFSCHSCHSDGHTNGLLNDNQGDDTFNTPKKILTLMGSGDTEPWAWNGSQIDLQNQVQKSIEFTMAGPSSHGPKMAERELDALTAFISSFEPAPGITAARKERERKRPAIERGQQVFLQHKCNGCHAPPRYSSPLGFDVGLRDEAGQQYFNPPSLLGVSQRAPYFHTGQATTLREVLLDFDHDGASSLEDSQIDDLIEFLQSL